jgi:hypothetical protein
MSQTSPKSISFCGIGTNTKCVFDDASGKCERCKKMGYSEECKMVLGPAKQFGGLELGGGLFWRGNRISRNRTLDGGKGTLRMVGKIVV